MSDLTDTGNVDVPEDYGKDSAGQAKRWLAEISAYNKLFGEWEKRARSIQRRYRNDAAMARGTSTNKLNLLWSNIETLKSALYGRADKPDVSRKYKDRDPIGTAAAVILQRSLEFGGDDAEGKTAMRSAYDDWLLGGRGQVWLRYVPSYGEPEKTRNYLTVVDTDGEEGEAQEAYENDAGERVSTGHLEDDDGNAYTEGEDFRPVVFERVAREYVNWHDFGHTPAPTWKSVRAVWKRLHLTRKQLIERFGEEKGKEVKLTKLAIGVTEPDAKKYGDVFKRAEVYEVWEKTSRTVFWVSPGYKELLDQKKDPLNLMGFFPCPRPLYATMTGDTLVPVPDFIEYQDQAHEIDVLTKRIHLLSKALKVAGVYDGAFEKLGDLLKSEENTLIPVDDWAMFGDKGGLTGAITFLPLSDIAGALQIAITTRNVMKRDLYEVTGLSDILRGQASGGRATATEQRIKGQFANLRLSDRQELRKEFDLDVMRIEAEIIAEHFDRETLLLMSGWPWTTMARVIDERNKRGQGEGLTSDQAFDKALELLRSDKLRSFRLAIETGATVLEDVSEEKKSRTEFVTAVGQFLGQALPAAEKYPQLAPALVETLFFAVRGFKAGRQLEMAFEHAFEDMREAAEQKQGASPDDQAQQAEQMKAQVSKAQGELGLKKIQMEMQREEAEHNFKMAEIDAKHRAVMEEKDADANLKAADMSEAAKDRVVDAGEQETRAAEAAAAEKEPSQ